MTSTRRSSSNQYNDAEDRWFDDGGRVFGVSGVGELKPVTL
nr:hypothetical protein [Kibdelosporangium sp. MJ126-NF4]CEL21053.1 hypothetical protein [Kibdelosporangium sp. MJ126-NF4]CTQ95433.1 hypothetical protein [Kibdelosporangium sp. MJ126-NF4]